MAGILPAGWGGFEPRNFTARMLRAEPAGRMPAYSRPGRRLFNFRRTFSLPHVVTEAACFPAWAAAVLPRGSVPCRAPGSVYFEFCLIVRWDCNWDSVPS